ncbi:hypothetical protein O181_049039 [Austropuccinia psidii MF-1]|uniref:Helitron helicase-like domain-containing protein n=1 Tax=Austropuccinia psidii MF-1 TaxID=1389203 RepID=A0A9Q3DU47_9BASI|nr:hypothetical protein [Austropuccinia psidii MF-1]
MSSISKSKQVGAFNTLWLKPFVNTFHSDSMVHQGLAVAVPEKNTQKDIYDRFPWEFPLRLGDCSDICKACGALHWIGERNRADLTKETSKHTICCQQGVSTLFQITPLILNDTCDLIPTAGKAFRANSRAYNNSLSFTSLGVHFDETVQGRGPYCFRVRGELHHKIGSIFPMKEDDARFAQIFVVGDGQEGEVKQRIKNSGQDLDHNILKEWQNFLSSNNPYVKTYRVAKDIIGDNIEQTFALKTLEGRQLNRSTYNLPTVSQVAMVVKDGDKTHAPRDIILHRVSGSLQHIYDYHSAYLALRYPILFPYGEQHWHPNALQVNWLKYSKVSQSEWYAYLLFDRKDVISLPLRSKRLFQEFVVDLYLCVERSRLRYIRSNQRKLKVDMYQGLTETLEGEGDVNGKKIVLPSTFIGGPRAMTQLYQDAMALVKHFGRPSLFITITANPKWPEIQATLKGDETPSDRPDLVARVFQLKLNVLLRDLTVNKRLGTVLSYVYTIEFQKRGLPHAHIIMILAESSIPKTVREIDAVVCAEIPDQEQEKDLFSIVTKTMLHAPCEEGSHCWTNRGCKWGYPKPYAAETSISNDAYPVYRRRQGSSFKCGSHVYTNQDVIPYNKYLLLRYQCHANVEIPYGIKALKYLYKYICKGEDRSALNLEADDETNSFVNGRYIGPSEASWRLFQFHMSGREPAIQRLSLHLEDKQLVYFRDEAGAIQQIVTGSAKKTTLTEFFKLNRCNAVGKGMYARKLLYHEVPQYFYWCRKKKEWVGRVKSQGSIGRLFFAKMSEGERYYLRLLLLHRRNIQSFEDLRKFGGTTYSSYREAANESGLLLSDNDYRLCITEAGEFMTGARLREIFCQTIASIIYKQRE